MFYKKGGDILFPPFLLSYNQAIIAFLVVTQKLVNNQGKKIIFGL
jgi:hypothetical protein